MVVSCVVGALALTACTCVCRTDDREPSHRRKDLALERRQAATVPAPRETRRVRGPDGTVVASHGPPRVVVLSSNDLDALATAMDLLFTAGIYADGDGAFGRMVWVHELDAPRARGCCVRILGLEREPCRRTSTRSGGRRGSDDLIVAAAGGSHPDVVRVGPRRAGRPRSWVAKSAGPAMMRACGGDRSSRSPGGTRCARSPPLCR
jgi:hypothetical protein